MPSHYLFLVLLLVLAAVYLTSRRIRKLSSGYRSRIEVETTIMQDARFARQAALNRRLSVLQPQFWSLSARSDEQQIEYRLIKEQLRIARWNLSYYQLLVDNPQHNNATVPGEKDWALTSAELALTFAAGRIERFRLMPSLTPCRPTSRLGAVS